MNKFISIISVSLALGLGFASCSDDEVVSNQIGSQLNDDHSMFYLPSDYLELDPDITQIVVNLMPQDGHQEYSIVASVDRGKNVHVIKMPLEEMGVIADGIYIMSCETMAGESLKTKLNVEFKDNMLHCVNYKMMAYNFGDEGGSGTESDPYRIKTAEDFDTFKFQLMKDTEKGRGQYFSQEASFEAIYDYNNTNRGYGCEEFAGNYEGGNNTISFEYFGSGKDSIDSNRGMFSVLRDGATISNLKIDASMKNINNNAGALAGVVNGKVKISNVYYHTDISSQSGYDNSQNIGGLIGKLENASLTVKSAGTSDKIIAVSGKSCVGGLIGSVYNSDFNIDKVKITHEVSSANQDVTPIYSSGNYSGGLIGNVVSTSNVCYISGCEVTTSIKAQNDYVGGLIGSCASSYTVCVDNCTVSSFLRGEKYIGGLIGEFSGSGRLQLGSENAVKNKNISGMQTIGGIVGKLSDTNISMSGTTKVLFGEDGISATKNVVGGFVGELAGTDLDFYYTEIEFNNALTVSGNMCVGGIVGLMSNSTLSSSNIVSFSSSIPKADRFNVSYKANVNGNSRVGGAVGHATNSTISGIYANANVTGTDSIGGIVGSAELSTTSCVVSNCIYNGSLKAVGKDVGGICGKFTKDGKINYCINYAQVEGSENVGGIAGAANYGETTQARTFFHNCVNVGNVIGQTDVAGIVGYMHGDGDYYIQVTSCANYGCIQGKNSTTGGIVGLMPDTKGRIYNCANHGTVHSSSGCRTGGIIGKMGKDPTGAYQSTNLEIGWCANKGSVVCDGDSEVGGIVGYAEEGAVDWNDHDSWVHDCYNTGKVSESGGEAGGIIGYSDRYCYLLRLANYGETNYAIVGDYKYGPDLYDDYTYYTKGSQTNNIADTYVSNPGDKSSYDGFDFTNTWQIFDGKAILQDSKCPFQNKTYTP